MRVIRAAGQNVSPADDGRLYSKAFADGLFEDVAISSLGTNLVSIGSLYGIICGRDFTAEAQNINVVLPETEGTTEGVIYVEIDISSDDVITIDSALKPFTPTYEDINMNGAVAQMVIAEYTATPVAVTDVTSVYPVATAGGIGSMATIELSPVQNSYAVGDFLVWKGQLYKVTAAIASGETLVIGTNIEAVTIGSELTALNNGLIVPLMSNTEFHAVNQTIAQGSYYECPVDGFYSWAVYGGNNATAMLFLDSDNNITKAFYASDTSNANHIVSFPFKAGTKVYARSSFGNYVVKGYWTL